MGKGKLVLGIIVLLVGLFYAVLPHTTHVSSGIDFGLDHTSHIVLGVILIIVGIVIIWKGR
jgi:hypothetical protein